MLLKLSIFNIPDYVISVMGVYLWFDKMVNINFNKLSKYFNLNMQIIRQQVRFSIN